MAREDRPLVDRSGPRTYGVEMSEIPENGPPDPDQELVGNEVPADAFSPVIDPELIPDTHGGTPEQKRARKDPEETGS